MSTPAEIERTDHYRQLMVYPMSDDMGSSERLIGISFIDIDPSQFTFNDWVDHFTMIGMINIENKRLTIFDSNVRKLNFYKKSDQLLEDLRQVLQANAIVPTEYKYT